MAPPTAGVCTPWITDDDLDAGTCCADLTVLTRSANIACNILYRLTGRQYPGICERTVRPCGTGCAAWGRWPAYRDHWWHPARTAAGGWETIIPPVLPPYGACGGSCHLSSVVLPAPVTAVNQVVVDGVELDPTAYRVVNHRRLERLDGNRWPCFQNMAGDSDVGGDTNTFQVTYLYGRLPGVEGIAAATEYACELAKAACPAATGECRLPERTRTVTRQGITFDITAPLDFLEDGLTGLPNVDLWIRSVNPSRLPRRAKITRFDV